MTADPIPGAVWTLRELRSPDGVTGAVGLAEPASRRGPFRERSLPLTYWWTYTLRGAKGAEATVTWADIQAAAGTSAPAPELGNPASARTPYGLLGGDWYLTLPTGKPGSPDTVRQPALAGYSSDWFLAHRHSATGWCSPPAATGSPRRTASTRARNCGR